MSRSDRRKPPALGPFYNDVQATLSRATLKELKSLLLQRARELPADERSDFLTMLQGSGPSVDWTAIDTSVHATLSGDVVDEVHHLTADLRAGKYFEHRTLDPATKKHRAFGDLSWVARMRNLFQRADVEYLADERAVAGDAYEALFDVFSLDDGATFCGPDAPEQMVGVDLGEAKARMFRCIYQTTPAHQRSIRMLEAVRKAAAHGPIDVGVQAMQNADIVSLNDLAEFYPSWLDALRVSDPTHRDELSDPSWQSAHLFLLKEAVELAKGSDGLALLAREKGGAHPEFYRSWVAALRAESDFRGALAAAREAFEAVHDPIERAAIGDDVAELAAWCDEHALALEARHRAWRNAPTSLRLVQFLVEGYPTSVTLDERVQDQLRAHLRHEYALNDMLASMLELLAGHYNVAVRRLEHASPLGWSNPKHAGPLLLPFALHAGSGVSEPPPQTCIATLWTAMDDAVRSAGTETSGASNILFSTLLQSAMRMRPPDPTLRSIFLETAAKVAVARATAIVTQKNRRAYLRAAVVVVACVEGFILRGESARARSFLGEFRRSFPQHRTFQFELKDVIAQSPVARRLR